MGEPNEFRIATQLVQTDCVVVDTFWIGVYPGLTEQNIAFMLEQIKKVVKL